MTNPQRLPFNIVGTAQRRMYGHVRVLVVDDSSVVRRSVVRRLSTIPGVKVVGEAESPAEGIRAVSLLRPSVVILDIEMPGGSGLDVLTHIKGNAPRVTVMMFSGFRDSHMRGRCLQLGADHCFLKPEQFSELVDKVSELAQHIGWKDSVASEAKESALPE